MPADAIVSIDDQPPPAATLTGAFGGLTGSQTAPLSAFLGDHSFAARTADGAAAIVSGEVLVPGLPAKMQNDIANCPGGCTHLQWGFFFGDLAAAAASGAASVDHVNLGTWVAGRIPTAAEIASFSSAAPVFRGRGIPSLPMSASLRPISLYLSRKF